MQWRHLIVCCPARPRSFPVKFSTRDHRSPVGSVSVSVESPSVPHQCRALQSTAVSVVGVTVNALHPGSVRTNLYSHIPQPLRFVFAKIVSPLLFRVRQIQFLGYVECMRCRLLSTMISLSVHMSVCHVAQPGGVCSVCGVIRCSLCKITLASCYLLCFLCHVSSV